jgi:2-oxoglutarate ferredoxin oxidoreductase subunit beta
MSTTSTQSLPSISTEAKNAPAGSPAERKGLTKKDLAADHPTWCPGCGDFSVLALYFRLLEKRKLHQDQFVSVSGIGCSSRFPYFVQAHGAHFIHGRALPFATGIALSRPDLHVFAFSGDGDAFSIGGNHFTHTARKNVNMTLVVMDNQVYGLTKKQTSPTSPLGFKSKTDGWGAIDYPINPLKQAIAMGATFVARTTSTNPNHVLANPRKGGVFNEVPKGHDLTDEMAAYQLASTPFPGHFGVFYRIDRPTKNEKEGEIITKARSKMNGKPDWQILQSTFERLK